jgi:hypothetical protein
VKNPDNLARLVAFKVFYNGKIGNIGVDIQKIQKDLAQLAEKNKKLQEEFNRVTQVRVEMVKEAVKEKVEAAKEVIKERYEDAKEAVKEKVVDVKEKAVQAKEALTQKIESVKDGYHKEQSNGASQ